MKTLISIGTIKGHSFARLLRIIDQFCDEGILCGSDVIAQIGDDKYVPKNYKAFDLISDDEFKRLISEADLVICHGGTGTVTSCIKQNKKVIIFPRLSKYNEHYDNHQTDLALTFARAGYVQSAMTKSDLKKLILSIDSFKPKDFKSNNKRINSIIINYIEKNH